MYYLLNIFIFFAIFYSVNPALFDRYSGKKVEITQAKELRLKNATERCSIEVKPCTPHEGSRIDGSCNNHKYPVRGTAKGPYLRLLKPDYGNNSDIRTNSHGNPLPSARKVRTELQSTGRVEDKRKFNMAAYHMLEFIHRDISYMNGPLDFLKSRQHCCSPLGDKDPRCIAISVPNDDPYLKVTDIRCLNFSRAETFQHAECTDILLPEQINYQTPVLDLSTIYGVDDRSHAKIRKFEQGLLNLETRDNRYLPPNITADSNKLSTTVLENMKSNMLFYIKKDLSKKLSANKINNTIANVTSNMLSSMSSDLLTTVVPTIPNVLPDTISNMIPNITANLTNNINLSSEMLANMTSKMLTNVVSNILADSLVNMVNEMIEKNPPSLNESVCIQNNETESYCYQFGLPEVGNYDLRTTSLTIYFMREHNRLAKELRRINPCWKDDRLFKVARQINIGTASNIFMYELLPALLGYRNMLNYGLLSETVEHVTAYDVDAVSLVYAEYDIAVRFFRTFLDGRVKTYTEDYHYNDEYSYSNTLFRSGLLEKGKVMAEINRGTFLQYAAKIDDIQDPEISENFYGGNLQRAHDLPAMDIQRGRDIGIRGYNEYRSVCGLKQAEKFDDLLDVMDVEKVEILKRLYEKVDDIDLLAGIMSESDVQGIHVGPTLFCIMTKQLQIFRFADRFWFERGDQYHSFTIDQLEEIRKTTMARLACDNAEGMKSIQPQAFMNVRPGNMQVPCSHIPGIDISRWRDSNCHKSKNRQSIRMPAGYKTKQSFYGTIKEANNQFSPFFDSLESTKPDSLSEGADESFYEDTTL